MGNLVGHPCVDHLSPWMDAWAVQEVHLCRSGLPKVRAGTARRVLTDTGQEVVDQENYCEGSLGRGQVEGNHQVLGVELRSQDSHRVVDRATEARGLCTYVLAVPC